MEIIATRADLSTYLASFRKTGKIVGLVPTMGALHAGHIDLLETLRSRCDILVCSIFVNPTQFNSSYDLDTYPRTLEEDLSLLERHGCDIVFVPSISEMYPEPEEFDVNLGRIAEILEGAHRPGHFNGVAQIVKKLFDLVLPQITAFGQKDYQQIAIVRRLIEMFQMRIKLVVVPTVREESGLALSSRNRRLSEVSRNLAANIYRIISEVPGHFEAFGRSYAIGEAFQQFQKIPQLKPEYLEICEQTTLEVTESWSPGLKYVVLTAVWVDGVRLIDNVLRP